MEPGFKTRLADCRVGIIGLGLMGGSLTRALREARAFRSIRGHDIDPHAIEHALERGLIDGPIDFSGPTLSIDLIILAVPVQAILDWIVRLSTNTSSFHLIDLGSTKARIVEEMQRLPDGISPLGGHPMCGKETAGLDAADGDLYRGCTFVLTPLARTLPTTLSIAHELMDAIGARPLILDPVRHDRIAAAISHVPYLISIALVDAARQQTDEIAWTMAASGFRDSTRLAASDVTMMLDILTTNRAAVLESLSRVQSSLQDLIQMLERDDNETLHDRLASVRNLRQKLYS